MSNKNYFTLNYPRSSTSKYKTKCNYYCLELLPYMKLSELVLAVIKINFYYI